MLSELIKNKDVKIIVKTLFNVELAPTQEKIVRTIAYSEHKRVVINSMTRYGKSFSISLGVLLYILFNENKKIIIVSPTYLQSRIVMNYIADNLIKSNIFINLVEFEAVGAERLKKQVTKSRITFKNGCELQMLSAEGKAQRLMGFGADIVICLPEKQKISTDKGNIDIDKIVKEKLNVKVLSYNHSKKETEFKEIEEFEVNPARDLIEFDVGKTKFVCTEDHPVFVEGKGYVPAKLVQENDVLWGKFIYN